MKLTALFRRRPRRRPVTDQTAAVLAKTARARQVLAATDAQIAGHAPPPER